MSNLNNISVDKNDLAHKITPIAAVNGVIFNENSEILLTLRSSAVREPGKWCLPGGHLDAGETWLQGFRREIQEEVGLRVTAERLIGIYSNPDLTVTEKVLDDGKHGQFLVALFLVESYEGDIKPNHEVEDWDWFPIDCLPEPIIKSHPDRIRDAYDFQGECFVR